MPRPDIGRARRAVNLWTSDEEWYAIRQLAKEQHYTIAGLLRRLALEDVERTGLK